ncbi:LOW QUALITY PROTEIN: inactive peptidyl-prolyl cis-trans isomerase FKBP6-like [Tachypleus tridentatus]|uniref:LOW QUALITY PROTEIN: inactive peptidyl-prolyl cis-trans isomerase FKBP6-like n=1 Tax=Tachypleus tridentatus TaxID=6853 RepID=UPI003FD3C8A3
MTSLHSIEFGEASSIQIEDRNECFEDEFFRPTHALKKAINLSELREDRGVEFEVEIEDEESNEENEYFDEEELKSNLKFECTDIGSESEDEENYRSPFQHLSNKMIAVTNDKMVLKKEVKPGIGPVVPKGSFVTVHYNGYLEYSEEPFDSTRLRNLPFKFLLGKERVILGLDKGVGTMKKGEVAQFLIRPEYAFRQMGCPPRIPPNATVMYEVELISYIDGAAAEFDGLTPEKKETSFERILAVCKSQHQAGNDFYKQQMYQKAITRYKKAVHLLETFPLANEEQEKQQQNLLMKLYLNLSLANLTIKEAGRCIFFARRSLEIQNNNIKALFRMGKGFMMKGDFEKAHGYFQRALKLNPNEQEIIEEIRKLDKQRADYEMMEKDFCKKMFGQQK